MKKCTALLLILALCACICACADNPLPAIADLDAMTDAQIEALLLGRPRQELISKWGEPQATYEIQGADEFRLNPEHLPDKSHKIIFVYYDSHSTAEKIEVEYCN